MPPTRHKYRYSPWDMPLHTNSGHQFSNFQSFLESITPSVPAQLQLLPNSKIEMLNGFGDSLGNNKDTTKFFSLSDLWEFYNEWSGYGAGVPILLNSGETVLQLYSPSLSALRLYTEEPFNLSRLGMSCRTNDSWSDDSEGDRKSLSLSNISCRASDITSDDSTTGYDGSFQSQTMDPLGHLYCQYSENSGPYDRVPFTSKVKELSENYPGLMKLKSLQLSPYSWMAVAWYPIYQIPFTSNAKELSACFITYHSLSSLPGLPSSILEEHDKFQRIYKVHEAHGGRMLERDSRRGEIDLPPFAVATYKLYGDMWANPDRSDEEDIASYLNAANSWLKHQKFLHHDFNFFMSRR